MSAAGLQAAPFAPAGGWVLLGRAGGRKAPPPGRATFAARGIPDACFVWLRGFVADGHAIRSIDLPAADAQRWVIVTDRGHRTGGGIPDDCFAALAQGWKHGLRPTCIAFPPATADDADAGGAWVMLAGRTVPGRGVNAACRQRLNNLAQRLRPARQVAFAPGGGWAIVSDDGVTAHGLADVCRAHIGQVAQTQVVDQLCFTPGGGWLIAPATPRAAWPADPPGKFEQRFLLVAGR